MKTFLTSDWHHDHKNIIKYSKRPFSNVDEMNEKLIENYNSVVSDEDLCYFVGDLSFAKKWDTIYHYYSRLKGRKILVYGNHDFYNRDNYLNSGLFEECAERITTVYNFDGKDTVVVIDHFPLLEWNSGHHGALNLHGHCHGSIEALNKGTRRYDVGVDTHNFFPVLIEDIWAKVKNNGAHKHHG